MTQGQMIEMIQQLFPEVGETQLRLMLNSAYKEYIAKVKIYSSMSFTVTTTSGQRYYSFSDFDGVTNDEDIISVYRVDYDGDIIKRFAGDIETTDAS